MKLWNKWKKWLFSVPSLLLALCVALPLGGCSEIDILLHVADEALGYVEEIEPSEYAPESEQGPELGIDRDASYTSAEDVALYLHTYGELPPNFITKKEAQALGWQGGSLEEYAPGKCIGGDHFGNYEGLLPEKEGRTYRECDIDTLGAKSRGEKRIVYSNDGLIYYTPDHYESFELLYGQEDG